MNIQIAGTDEEVMKCYAVMRALRPHIEEADFLPRVRRLETNGYRLAYVEVDGGIVAVAGIRLGENLAWGRYLYVDDLVTLPAQRSRGHGAALLGWLREYARNEGCDQLHLDSGLQRKEAHRFYLREGMTQASLHFAEHLNG